jgi:hypothetical protein
MKFALAAALLLAVTSPAPSVRADPVEAREKLLTLPHADVARLVGNWQVKEMEPIKMIYEFQLATMAMHGSNEQGGTHFELLMDADYRTAGDKAIWVIGTHPRPVADDMTDGPSIMGIEFTSDSEAKMTVSAGESFTLIKVP